MDGQGAPTPGVAEATVSRTLAELEGLEARVRAARSDVRADPLASASRLAGLEGELLRVGRDLERIDADLADDRGHPVLADVARWRTRLRQQALDGPVARANVLVDELVDDAAVRWRARAEEALRSPDPRLLFDLLAEATEFDQEAVSRRAADEAPPLAGERPELRAAFLDAIEARPPSEARRDRWATALLDRADVVLTAIDEMAPAKAASQLELVRDDFDWHLRHVETSRSVRRSRLTRKRSRLRAEEQERDLQAKLETRFGRRAVGRWERMIVGLIVLVLVLLAAETFLDLPPDVVNWMRIIDTAACLVFLWDFFYRLRLVRRKWLWFRRHVFVDLIPSLPVGILTLSPQGADPIRLGRALRFLRLMRVARYLRVLMPVIRTFRAFGFLTRGIDRMVRRYGHLLNRDIILYPTRAEKERARVQEETLSCRLRRLEAEVTDLWEDLLVSAPPTGREGVADRRLEGLAHARHNGLAGRREGLVGHAATAREVPAEALVRRLGSATAEGIEANQGADFVSRIARALRTFSRPPLKWIPFIRRYIPRLGVGMSDGEVAAAGARHLSDRLRGYLERWFFFADLYGTVTPAEFVDRVGGTLVKGAFRPAYRLTLFGIGLLVVELLFSFTQSDFLQWLSTKLNQFLGTPILILGGIALAVLTLGWWLQRVAGEATAFYEQTVAAQFLPLMESIKGRFLGRDARILTQRVFTPEHRLRAPLATLDAHALEERFADGVRAWLLEAQTQGEIQGAFDAMERTLLLYRDGMDGAILAESDTRTTNQLLGNPALRHLRRTAGCVSARERKELKALDLSQQRRLFGGPYMWFSLIMQAVAHTTARLIIEYNRHAIPLDELPSAAPAARRRYQHWLEQTTEDEREQKTASAMEAATDYFTMAFTALHFLDDDERRDREVELRFGTPVAEKLRRDRRRLFRRVFGTYPLHTRPHGQRVVNLYRIYEEYFAGGRALLLPLRGIWAGLRWIGRIIGWVAGAVQEIKDPRRDTDPQRAAEADFETAVRKIDRMRGPVLRASLWLRARMDCEYLGLRLPGAGDAGRAEASVQRDLHFLQASPHLRRRVEDEHDLAQADMRRLGELIDGGLLDRAADLLDLLDPPGHPGVHPGAGLRLSRRHSRHPQSAVDVRHPRRSLLGSAQSPGATRHVAAPRALVAWVSSMVGRPWQGRARRAPRRVAGRAPRRRWGASGAGRLAPGGPGRGAGRRRAAPRGASPPSRATERSTGHAACGTDPGHDRPAELPQPRLATGALRRGRRRPHRPADAGDAVACLPCRRPARDTHPGARNTTPATGTATPS